MILVDALFCLICEPLLFFFSHQHSSASRLRRDCMLGFDLGSSWPQSHLPLWQLSRRPTLTPASLSIYPSLPSFAPWPIKLQPHPPASISSPLKKTSPAPLLFTSTFRLFFHEASSTRLQLSPSNGNHRYAYTFGLSSADKVKTSTGQHLRLMWFLFTLWALGLFFSVWKFFSPFL